jgi:hypothetical protein
MRKTRDRWVVGQYDAEGDSVDTLIAYVVRRKSQSSLGWIDRKEGRHTACECKGPWPAVGWSGEKDGGCVLEVEWLR